MDQEPECRVNANNHTPQSVMNLILCFLQSQIRRALQDCLNMIGASIGSPFATRPIIMERNEAQLGWKALVLPVISFTDESGFESLWGHFQQEVTFLHTEEVSLRLRLYGGGEGEHFSGWLLWPLTAHGAGPFSFFSWLCYKKTEFVTWTNLKILLLFCLGQLLVSGAFYECLSCMS